MKPPSDEAVRLLQRYKEASAPGAEQKARLGDVVRERLLRGDLPRFDVVPFAPATPEPSLVQRLWSSTAGKLALGAVAVGAAGGASYPFFVQESLPSQRPAASAAVARAASPPLQSARPSSATTATEEKPVGETAPQAPASKTVRSRAENTPPAAVKASEATVDEEVELVNASQAALRAGNTAQALDLLAQHAARFPSGKLATLRQVTRMMALCQSGRTAQARQEAADFIAKKPDSPFVERVKTICLSPSTSPH